MDSLTICAQKIDSINNSIHGKYEFNGARESHQLILQQDSTYIEYYMRYIGYYPLTFEIWGQYELSLNTIVLKPRKLSSYRKNSSLPINDTIAVPIDLEKHNDTMMIIPFHETLYLIELNKNTQDSGGYNNIELFIGHCEEHKDQPHRIFPFLSKECEACSTIDVDLIVQELRERIIKMYSH